MEENKELNAPIKAIGEWAAQNPKRIAFVVCGETTESGVSTTNALVGRSDRIARALYGNAKECKEYKFVLTLVASALESPIGGAALSVISDMGSVDKESIDAAVKNHTADKD